MADKTEYKEVPVSLSLSEMEKSPKNGTNSDIANAVSPDQHSNAQMINDTENNDVVNQYIVYSKRWLMLFLFVMYSATNAFQWTELVIISNVIENYYSVSTLTVTWYPRYKKKKRGSLKTIGPIHVAINSVFRNLNGPVLDNGFLMVQRRSNIINRTCRILTFSRKSIT